MWRELSQESLNRQHSVVLSLAAAVLQCCMAMLRCNAAAVRNSVSETGQVNTGLNREGAAWSVATVGVGGFVTATVSFANFALGFRRRVRHDGAGSLQGSLAPVRLVVSRGRRTSLTWPAGPALQR
eukprot:2082330-Alexandrium_andersonii.AAC.1